jgi:hypothetical protein
MVSVAGARRTVGVSEGTGLAIAALAAGTVPVGRPGSEKSVHPAVSAIAASNSAEKAMRVPRPSAHVRARGLPSRPRWPDGTTSDLVDGAPADRIRAPPHHIRAA